MRIALHTLLDYFPNDDLQGRYSLKSTLRCLNTGINGLTQCTRSKNPSPSAMTSAAAARPLNPFLHTKSHVFCGFSPWSGYSHRKMGRLIAVQYSGFFM